VAAIQALRGMNDIFSPHINYWQFIESSVRELMLEYGYNEIRFPILESTALFQRGLGDTTDIVEKEMYTFIDRNGESLTMRPEGTAGCVRTVIQHGLLHHLPQRLWYLGPMYRHERPQQGRYRQFYQVGVEVFGLTTPTSDVEIIAMAAQLWRKLGIADSVKLNINSLGTPETRQKYREELITYLTPMHDQLDADSQRRLHRNPMRILDSKNPQTQELVAHAPRLLDRLDDASQQHFSEVIKTLEQLAIPYVINPSLVRGLDYYTHTVFEWITDRLGAQDAVCSGGRYDGLVEQLGGKPTPAVGFALGMERLIALVSATQEAPVEKPHAYVIAEKEYLSTALQLVERLRAEVSGLRIIMDNSGASLKSQFKKADKSDAHYALVLGEQEVAQEVISVKPLRENTEQLRLRFNELVEFFKK
jgi:histidyl-tRNA synthetase